MLSWKLLKDEEPRFGQTVILFSKKSHKFFDGEYICEGTFRVNDMQVPASNFDIFIDRFTFFQESGLRDMKLLLD